MLIVEIIVLNLLLVNGRVCVLVFWYCRVSFCWVVLVWDCCSSLGVRLVEMIVVFVLVVGSEILLELVVMLSI